MVDLDIANIMVLVAVVGVVWFLRSMMASSERRMMRMMRRAGLDPEIATKGDTESIIREIRRRCRRCQSEDPCERWLDGELEGDSIFCPNARIFEQLKQAERTRKAVSAEKLSVS